MADRAFDPTSAHDGQTVTFTGGFWTPPSPVPCTRGFWVGSGGDLEVDMYANGIANPVGTALVFHSLTPGWHPIEAKRVIEAGTNASQIVAVW